MAKDFFDAVNNYDPIKEVVPLAMEKFKMDMETSKFNMMKEQSEFERKQKLDDIAAKTKFQDRVVNIISGKYPDLVAQSNGAEPKTNGEGKPIEPKPLSREDAATAIMATVDPKKALEMYAKEKKPTTGQEPFAKINPKDYTPESVKTFMATAAQTGKPDYSVLKKVDAVEKEPKGDFETFKAGIPKLASETDTAWNKRVSDAWESKQDARAKQKVQFTIMEHEASAKKKDNITLDDSTQHTVDVMKKAIEEGRMAPSQLNTAVQRMGGGANSAKIRTSVVSGVLEDGYNLEAAENNYKAKGSSVAIQRVQLAKTVVPIANEVKTLVDKIPDDIGFVPADEATRKLGKLFNNNDLIKLEFDKNKMVEEFERMLTGSQMADTRVQRNLELLRTGYSKKALKELADEVIGISNMSTTAVTSDMYDAKPQGGSPAPTKPTVDVKSFWRK